MSDQGDDMPVDAPAVTGEATETEEPGQIEQPKDAFIHFGTLDKTYDVNAVAEGIQAGNIHQQSADQETMALPEGSQASRERHEALLAEFEARRRARALAVPTSDAEVRKELRALGEPITLFGEKELERRARLRQLLAAMDEKDGGELPVPESAEVLAEVPEEPEVFYTEGGPELMRCRGRLAQFSLPRAAARLQALKRKRDDPDHDEAALSQATAEAARTLSIERSEIGGVRPLSACMFSPDGGRLITSSWAGTCKVWPLRAGAEGAPEKELTIKAHEERVTDVAVHPLSASQEGAVQFASGSADCSARLWSGSGALVATLAGHSARLARLAFHPCGDYLGTCSFDHTWRLWDLQTQQELLCQEGHSRPVYDIAFQADGSLAATVGLDCHGRVWDLRIGNNIFSLAGHMKQTLAVDFSPNGYHVVTGAADNTAKVWDLRKRKCLYTIPAHSKQLSRVRFEPTSGDFLLTASYDHSAKIWNSRTFSLVKTLSGHEGRVMGADIVPGGGMVATVSYDRTVKLWAQEGGPGQWSEKQVPGDVVMED